ncbi:MAG: hypothetical protein PHP26_01805 [Syntrophomonas sp.]|uniref:hypothetical protein n=1 Tax=Syntrophomonas sp. TaxID=2053627 RepID=UPI00260DE1E3|nr:hypothetical protein [Syntrophomonas sp.]MDD2510676.1 hypothetical protein [Syntrophomonas sp.]MDD3878708.1 hypothetical protein [Syntrophomonas sp.]MDD4626156.1 hypothetical protein [Syntrophomonas sp.]
MIDKKGITDMQLIVDDSYLQELEKMNFPVVRSYLLSLEDFNEEMRQGLIANKENKELAAVYLEELELMEFPVIKSQRMSLEEFNEELRKGIMEDSNIEATIQVARGIKIKNLAMVS